MIKANDRIFELVCLTTHENQTDEFTLGFYSTEKIANEQKEECEKQAVENTMPLEYEVRPHRIIK